MDYVRAGEKKGERELSCTERTSESSLSKSPPLDPQYWMVRLDDLC